MTPKRIKRKRNTGSGTMSTPPMKIPNQGKKKPPVVIKKDPREEIVRLNSEKLERDITSIHNDMKASGIDGNSGVAGFFKNRFELSNFIEKAKADGLTNGQALARFKKQFNL
jgi:hypothetical protein